MHALGLRTLRPPCSRSSSIQHPNFDFKTIMRPRSPHKFSHRRPLGLGSYGKPHQRTFTKQRGPRQGFRAFLTRPPNLHLGTVREACPSDIPKPSPLLIRLRIGPWASFVIFRWSGGSVVEFLLVGSVLDLLASLIHFLGDLGVGAVTTAAVDTGAIRTNTLALY